MCLHELLSHSASGFFSESHTTIFLFAASVWMSWLGTSEIEEGWCRQLMRDMEEQMQEREKPGSASPSPPEFSVKQLSSLHSGVSPFKDCWWSAKKASYWGGDSVDLGFPHSWKGGSCLPVFSREQVFIQANPEGCLVSNTKGQVVEGKVWTLESPWLRFQVCTISHLTSHSLSFPSCKVTLLRVVVRSK